MRRTRTPGPVDTGHLATSVPTNTPWRRMFLGNATAVHPGGGATVTINSESAGGWTDITQAAINKKKPSTECSAYFYALTNPDTGAPLQWAEQFTIYVHLVVNQWGSTNGYRQNIMAIFCNSTALSTSDHKLFGEGIHNLNNTRIKTTRIYSGDSSGAPTFTSSQLASSGWTTAFRAQITAENSLDRGLKFCTIEYRDSDNTVDQGGFDDLEGVDYGSGVTAYQFGASDVVYLGLYWPGTNSSGANALTNFQFKAYYAIVALAADPVAAVGV